MANAVIVIGRLCSRIRGVIELAANTTASDIVLHGPYTRKIRVLSIGAGVTGIMNAYNIQKHLENVEHVIYEKNADIGGTWLENRYPGMLPPLACVLHLQMGCMCFRAD